MREREEEIGVERGSVSSITTKSGGANAGGVSVALGKPKEKKKRSELTSTMKQNKQVEPTEAFARCEKD